jgi:hypothetical protein
VALQPLFDLAHHTLAEGNPLLIDLMTERDKRLNPLPRHTLGPLHHGLDIDQLGPIPVQFQDTPATLDGIVLAVVGRVLQQLDRLRNVVGKLHHTVQKLGTHAAAFWAVIHFDLE